MVEFLDDSVVSDRGVIWSLFQYVPCYLSCSIYLLSNLLWCLWTSNLSTSQSAVCAWSLTKIDEGHSGAEGKGRGGLSVCATPPPPPIHPSLLPSVLLTVTEDWGLFWSAWTDGQHSHQEKQRKKEREKNTVEDKYDEKRTEICGERHVEA